MYLSGERQPTGRGENARQRGGEGVERGRALAPGSERGVGAGRLANKRPAEFRLLRVATGSASGTAESSSRVYGCAGWSITSGVLSIPTIRPRSVVEPFGEKKFRL